MPSQTFTSTGRSKCTFPGIERSKRDKPGNGGREVAIRGAISSIQTFGRSRAVALYVVAFVIVVLVPLVLAGAFVVARQNADVVRTERRTVGIEYALRDAVLIGRLRTLRAGLLLRGTIALPDRLAVEAALTRLYDFNSGTARDLVLDKRLKRLQDAWTAVPDRSRSRVPIDAALTAALDLERAIYERSWLRSGSDELSIDLVDAFAIGLPGFEARVDDMRTVVLLARRRSEWRAVATVANATSAVQGDRALSDVRADVARAVAADRAERPALADIAALATAWERFKTASDPADVDALGVTLLNATDRAKSTLGENARRALGLRLVAERRRLTLIEFGLLGAFAIVVIAGLLLIRAVRERDRSEVLRLRAETDRLSAEVEKKRALELLALTEARFDAVFERAAFGVAILDVRGRIVRRNAALERIAPGAGADDMGADSPEFAELVAGRREAYTVEVAPSDEHAGRCLESIVSLVRDDAGAPLFVVAMVTDVSERLEIAERMAYAATHDLAVDLPNRTSFFERLRATLEEGPNDGTLSGVAFIDFDGFKLVNDSLGHLAGERLLKEAARRLRSIVRREDVVARFGGDEFVVLLAGRESREELIDAAQRILAVLAEPVSIDDHDAYVTVTVGLAVADRSYNSAQEIVRDADTAMYAAKSSGRTRFALFDATMHDRSRRRLELAAALRHAIEREQLHLVYQPITSLATGRIQSFEVLLRWDHPELGLVNPAEFVPVAEEVGLIVPIGRWVFERACAQLARWREKRGTVAFESLHLSVNASVLELLQPGYCEFVERTIARHALHPGDIVLEITESTILESGRFAVATLDRLRTAGLRLAIDDFGTGYSSLRYLKEFPFDYLKIDGSFVRGKDGGLASEPIVTMIVALGNAVGVQVIAEGAETAEQVERLRALGCGAVQGFLFGSPSAAAFVPEILHAPLAG